MVVVSELWLWCWLRLLKVLWLLNRSHVIQVAIGRSHLCSVIKSCFPGARHWACSSSLPNWNIDCLQSSCCPECRKLMWYPKNKCHRLNYADKTWYWLKGGQKQDRCRPCLCSHARSPFSSIHSPFEVGLNKCKRVSNRVVHSWHFWSIFHSFLNHFPSHFVSIFLKIETENERKMEP